jgi:hypothetical protein
MYFRRMHALVMALILAQDASPYVPLSHWSTPYIEHWITRGLTIDPSPLTRPLTRRDLFVVLAAIDTNALARSERRVLSAMRRDLDDRERGAAARVAAHAGVAAASHTRRDPLRAAGPELGTASGGLSLELRLGPVTAVTHPYFDTRLRRDPDYFGKKDRVIAGRNAEAYIDARWRFGELFFGIIDRNWGPPAVEGLLISPAPYGYDHLFIAIGTPGLRLEGLVAQLDDLPDTSGTLNHRYYIAHRLLLRPPGPTTLVLWEGTLLAGPGRTLEPWYANIANLGLLAQYDQSSRANNQLGVDFETRVGGVRGFGSFLLDDFQIHRAGPADREPTSYGLTLGVAGSLGPAAWTLLYTRVSNLAYRTHDPAETVMRRSTGLARDFSDYDQLTLRTSAIAGPGFLVMPEITVLRQGEGDFRKPFPAAAEYPTTPAFHQGVIERTVRLAVALRADRRAVGLRGDAGLHIVSNAGHVPGERDNRFVGSVALEYRFNWSSVLP